MLNAGSEPIALDTEIVEMLYANNSRSLVAALVVMSALVFVQNAMISSVVLAGWSVIFLLAYGLRTTVTFLYYRDQARALHSRQWLQRFRLSSGVCGLAWGLAGILLFPEADTAHQAFLIFALVGVAGAGIVIYSIDTLCSNLFTGGLLLLMIPRFIIHGTQLSIVLAILFIVYVVYVTIAGRGLAQSLRENMTLRIASNLDNQKVHQLAYYDFLTGLPNRRLLSDRLNQAFIRCARTQTYGAVLSLDLNNFKGLNDSKGHLAGDELLQQVAERLQHCLRKKDTIARMGGDEFIAVLDDLGNLRGQAVISVMATAEKLMDAFSQPFQLKNGQYRSKPSMGVCLFLGEESSEAEVLRRADIAMYQAKKSENMHGIQLYDETQYPAIELRASLENDLAFALQSGQLSLYYQLQVDQELAPIGAEVLLRWQHPVLGMVPPDQFIPIAEESGAIVAIGHWVLQQSCAQLKAWEHDPAIAQLHLSVNVSALQFSQPDFVEQVMHTVKASGCNPRHLKLELTESAIVKNVDDVIDKINALKTCGITFSLDDFGIGQSSLSVLKRLPLDELKIDRSFISDILHNNYDTFIVQTIIEMGKNLGHHVIAEGVEVEQQKVMLQALGCQAFQGYLFCKPLSLADFEAKVQRLFSAAQLASATMKPALFS